ncbi:hypothetical protein SFRURICE_020583 [Spodoptera frugiperda]|nr:hypothetical protein SFRURICE_020583 [Spodoptera frugiperda]
MDKDGHYSLTSLALLTLDLALISHKLSESKENVLRALGYIDIGHRGLKSQIDARTMVYDHT